MNQKGRSMVEMLGVLAIIGVLSAGALAGYSKAMFRHKLNMQIEQISSLIVAEITYHDKIGSPENLPLADGALALVPIYKSLNVIPQNMIVSDSVSYLKDAFQSRVLLYTYDDQPWHAIRIELNTSQNITNCINIFETAKSYSPELLKAAIWKDKHISLFDAFGDRYCEEENTCLKDLQISDYSTACHLCENIESCQIYIWVE